jgi:TPR repeat protein
MCIEAGYEGNPSDPPTALHLYKLSAAQGYVSGQAQYARCFAKGIGAQQNLTKAYKWYKRAADQGDERSAFKYGRFLENENLFTEAITYYQMASDAGLAKAHVAIGRFLEAGVGMDQDYANAILFYQAAAEAGNGEAAYRYARMLHLGRGVTMDLVNARAYYQAALERGIIEAKQRLEELDDINV